MCRLQAVVRMWLSAAQLHVHIRMHVLGIRGDWAMPKPQRFVQLYCRGQPGIG